MSGPVAAGRLTEVRRGSVGTAGPRGGWSSDRRRVGCGTRWLGLACWLGTVVVVVVVDDDEVIWWGSHRHRGVSG